jgi:hypothetical protein
VDGWQTLKGVVSVGVGRVIHTIEKTSMGCGMIKQDGENE